MVQKLFLCKGVSQHLHCFSVVEGSEHIVIEDIFDDAVVKVISFLKDEGEVGEEHVG